MQFWLRRPHFCPCCALLGCWASVGTILGSCSAILGVFCGLCWPLLGKSWDHIGLILGHFGLCWDILGNVGTILGSRWAICAIFGSVSAFVLDLGISVSLNFRPCKAFAQNAQNTRKKYNLWTPLLMVFAAFFLFLSWGMLQLGYVCLISGLCWAILGYVGTCRRHIGLMLGHFVVFCGLRMPLLSHFRGILWFVLAFVGQELGPD